MTNTSHYILHEVFMRVISLKQNQQLAIDLENFLSKIDLEICKQFCNAEEFVTFQNQLAMVKRLFAL